ncbi:hypothetical protein U9M48_035579 [Paspalum notatum var. saurae]|uniref:Uncharacterized protein n=1 Tax=Paspalum notatum var. saurae TaxID=547442 RepID=A0AAQ3UBG4_PASNO
MAEQFRAGSSSMPVINPRPVSSYDPTSTLVFNPSRQYGPPPAFVPRSARTYTTEFIASQNMPHQAFYGIENSTAENYQFIDQIRAATNQYEQNTQSIEEQLQNLRFWNQGFQ